MAREVSVMAIPAVRSNLFCLCFDRPKITSKKGFPLPSGLKNKRIDFLFLPKKLEQLTFARQQFTLSLSKGTTQHHEYNYYYALPVSWTKIGLSR